ncbi:MAG: DUF192 domain-containing protein [Bacteroidetes bacterium]|nr:DUF192 domain-containing protein [Bacteroidota bacterium]
MQIFRKKWILAVLILLAVASLLLYMSGNFSSRISTPRTEAVKTIPFRHDGQLVITDETGRERARLQIEIAENDQSRAQGLMYRDPLPDTQGMLFLFPYDMIQTFWMKNTPSTLDMIFINSAGKIVTIHSYTQPFSTERYSSDQPARQVLEVRGGFCETYEITTGQTVSFTRNTPVTGPTP